MTQEPITTIDRDEFYTRAQAVGFTYGDAFQTIAGITSGDGWATADIITPGQIADDIDQYRFHPALIDGAFQTLIGTTLLGRETDEDAYLPTRIRRSAIYGAPEQHMTAQISVVSATKDEIESDITLIGDDGDALAVFTGFTLQSLSASSRMSPERVDKGLYEIQWVAHTEIQNDQPEKAAASDSLSWLVFLDSDGIGTTAGRPIAPQRPPRPGSPAPTRHRADEGRRWVRAEPAAARATPPVDSKLTSKTKVTSPASSTAGRWTSRAESDGRHAATSGEMNDHLGVFTILHLAKAFAEHDAMAAAALRDHRQRATRTWNRKTRRRTGRRLGARARRRPPGVRQPMGRTDRHRRRRRPHGDRVAHLRAHSRRGSRGSDRHPGPHDVRPASSREHEPDASLPNQTHSQRDLRRHRWKREPSAASWPPTWPNAEHVILHCCRRSEIPPREQWSQLPDDHRHHATVDTIRKIEQLGARVTTASVDITDTDQVQSLAE